MKIEITDHHLYAAKFLKKKFFPKMDDATLMRLASLVPFLVPAYGREYESGEQAVASFMVGAEFLMIETDCLLNGSVITVEDLTSYCPAVVMRYNRKKPFVGIASVEPPTP